MLQAVLFFFFLKGTFKNLCQAIEASSVLEFGSQQKFKIKLENKIQT